MERASLTWSDRGIVLNCARRGAEVWLAVEPSRGGSVQGDYVLLEQIGQRAGNVFRAQHVREQRAVIVRIWRAPDKAKRDRFLELAQLARSVRHPALPAIEAFGHNGDNTCYVVTECAHGESLDRWADRMGIPSVASAIELFQRVCVALNAAHRNGLMHDALNARNLFVTESDNDPLLLLEPCVLDLGVPAFVRAFPPPLRAARFMAPEQLARALHERAMPAADVRMNVYSCGNLLHYVCTGGAPFLGRTLEEFAHAQAVGHLLPPSCINPQIPPALDAVIMRALAHDPSERYASMAELGHALERVRTGTGASGVRPKVVPVNAPTHEFGHFDERPTTEAPRLLLTTPLRPPSVPGMPAVVIADAAPAVANAVRAAANAARAAANAARAVSNAPAAPGATEDEQRRAPAGLFSSAPAATSETPQQGVRRSARAIALGTQPESDDPEVSVARHSAALHVDKLEAALARAWKRVLPETKRWLGATATAIAAIALALRLANAPAAPHTAQVQPAPDSAMTPVPVPPMAVPMPVRAPVLPAALPAPAPLDAPDLQLTTKLRARKPARDTEPPTAPIARTRNEPRADTPREAATARAATPASTQLTVLPREPALEIKPIEHAEPSEPKAPAPTPADVPHEDPVSAATPTPTPARADTASATKPRTVARLAAQVRANDLVVHGSVATSVVRRAIDRMTPQLRACYARAAVAAGRNGFGTSSVEIEIDEHGRARDAHVRGSSLPGLDACVAQCARGLSADRPPDTGRVQASFKVAFTP